MLSLMLTSPFLLASTPGRRWSRPPSGAVSSSCKAGYVAAKRGVLGLVKTLALEVGAHDVCATAICPAYVRTPLVEHQVAAEATTHGLSESACCKKSSWRPDPSRD